MWKLVFGSQVVFNFNVTLRCCQIGFLRKKFVLVQPPLATSNLRSKVILSPPTDVHPTPRWQEENSEHWAKHLSIIKINNTFCKCSPLIKRSLAWLMSIRLVHAVLLSTIPCIRPPSHLITQGMQRSNQKTKKMPGNTWDLISHLLSLLTAKIYIFSSKMVDFVTNSPQRAVVQRCSFFVICIICLKFNSLTPFVSLLLFKFKKSSV